MAFNWNLSDSKSPQIFRNVLFILADLNNVIVWMVSNHPLISTSSSLFNNLSVIAPRSPITTGTIVTFMFQFFFQFPKVEVLILLFIFFPCYSVVIRDRNVDNYARTRFLGFFFIIISSGLLTEIRWSICMLKSHRSLCVSFSRTDVGLCIYHLFAWSN